MPRADLTGKRFGNLVAILPTTIHLKSRKMIWLFKCDCGKTKRIVGSAVTTGNSQSCGCGVVNATIRRNFIHGGSKLAEHRVWREMKKRCYNPKCQGYKNYGGRGIIVCNRWLHLFRNFLSDMGKRPSKFHSIDRKDNNGNYTPSNCQWSTKLRQNRNRRNNHVIEMGGVRKTISEWSEETGINQGTIECRLRRDKWPAAKALTVLPK